MFFICIYMYPCCYATLWNHSRTFFLQEGSARFLCARCFLHLNFLLFTNEQCLANLCVQGVWLFTNEQCLANLCVQGLWMQMQANALYHLEEEGRRWPFKCSWDDKATMNIQSCIPVAMPPFEITRALSFCKRGALGFCVQDAFCISTSCFSQTNNA